MTKNDGGPAFPCHPTRDSFGGLVDGYPGMSLRDYFAASVLPLLWPNYDDDRTHAAQEAYTMADAILKAREGA